jgi:hypothetical protein
LTGNLIGDDSTWIFSTEPSLDFGTPNQASNSEDKPHCRKRHINGSRIGAQQCEDKRKHDWRERAPCSRCRAHVA